MTKTAQVSVPQIVAENNDQIGRIARPHRTGQHRQQAQQQAGNGPPPRSQETCQAGVHHGWILRRNREWYIIASFLRQVGTTWF